ncbi:TonB-dependent siderophore receptor [Oleiagrimonas sp. C23AA]|uniref:TonB-dependent siderophore receptor n=1 Tax=Oleiagrimonas sp. C23AA TaxID=2719047 RepID=UPI00142431D0|nr:TonB-dependent siderophore receptor [Oleiagrimonas sp. C23AA]NII10269.1 TonB-dependent siderophore receptor [Oleiagrimonas sp. C23AA]
MPHRTSLYLALSLAAVGTTAHAQDTASDADAQHATHLSTVRVTGHHADGYDADRSQLGSFGGGALHDTPASVVVFTRDQIDDRQPRSLSELAKGDAALGDNYAAVGYYQDISVRGFPLDYATSFRQNNLTIAGAQMLPLEDKQQVEILKGLAGIEAGVVAPGGLINFVSKRPANVHTVTLGTDSHGSRYGTADLGGWLTPTFGLRFNAAYEDTHSFVQHADGRRNFYALAADWKISPSSLLELDGNYQTSAQRDASGYQLLGGTKIPAHASRTKMLGFEPWQQPVSIAATNLSARYTYTVNQDWSVKLAAGHNRSVIDDNVAYPYGCFYAASCASGDTPGYFFGPDGAYDVYDFRSPDDTRNNDEARATVRGHIDAGSISHDLTLGVQAFRRTVDQRQEVYDYVGTANIDQADPPYFAPSPNQPGPSARRLTSWQRSAFALDRVHLGDTWQVLAGARFVRLNERAYDDSGVLERTTRLSKTLPQAAVLWQPNAAITGYLSYGEGLSLGKEAPYWTANPNVIMPPIHSRQVEAGVKYAVGDHLDLTAALYRIRQPYQFAQPDDSAEGFSFVQSGQEVHTGLELGTHGQLTSHLRVAASASYIRARAEDTGTPSYEGHQVANVPTLRTSVNADYTLPFAPQLAVLGAWRYSAPKAALPDGSVRVGAYNVFDAGLRLSSHIAGHAAAWRLMVSNLFNRFYWRDTGSAYGDRFLFPSEPRLARLSVKFDL